MGCRWAEEGWEGRVGDLIWVCVVCCIVVCCVVCVTVVCVTYVIVLCV